MKITRWFLIGLVLLALAFNSALAQGFNNKIASSEPKAPRYLMVTLTTGTAIQASTTNLQFSTATFYGFKAVSATALPTANTAIAYAGFVDAAGSSGVAAASPAFYQTIGIGLALPCDQVASGTKLDLKNLYFLGTTGDKVLVVFTQ